MANEKLLGALGLARRAGALVIGFDGVKDALLAGRAQLVLAAADTSEGSVSRLQRLCGEDDIELRILPLEQRQLMPLLHKAVGVMAVTDENLAVLCRRNLPQEGEKED